MRPSHGDGRYLTDVWTEEAVEFIHRHRTEPFFLHVNYNAPHTPLQAPEHYLRRFDHLTDVTWGARAIYAMLLALDEGVARILDALRRSGIDENTIVVFSSDNGPQFGGQGEKSTTRFNCHWHGAKGSTYEGGIRVPGLIQWPAGGLEGGREVDRMVHFTDYFPTLLSAAGLEGAVTDAEAPPIDGVNVLGVLRGEDGETCTKRFWQWNRYSPVITSNAAVRDGEWKLVRPKISEAMEVPDIRHLHTSMYTPEYFVENGIFRGDPEREIPPPPPAELYNLVSDPREQDECSAEHPEVVERLTRELESWFEDVERDRSSISDEWRLNPDSGW
jgi:arylsulfatase A